MRYKERILLVTLFLLGIFLFIYFRRGPIPFSTSVRQPTLSGRSNKQVVIYAATKFFKMDITTKRFLSMCHSTKNLCRITEDRADLDKADAVLFHNADYTPEAVPVPRKLSRPHVLWSLESPANDYFRPERSKSIIDSHIAITRVDVINWTMTFRHDADIWYPYGHFRRLNHSRSIDFDAIWAMKNHHKTTTWLASNCVTQNLRRELVNAMEAAGLQYGVRLAVECFFVVDESKDKRQTASIVLDMRGKMISVKSLYSTLSNVSFELVLFSIDRYGKCGMPPPGCDGVDKQSHPCAAELIRPYKFYVSIENSNCMDYVTEKFFEALINRMTVPIVLRREIYTNIGAPPNSFIALDDFSSIAETVKFINSVAGDKEKYLQFHSWRTSYVALPEHHDDTGFCELCRRLQHNQLKHNSYEDVRRWHSLEQCDNLYGRRFLSK